MAELRALTRVQMNRGIPFSASGIVTMTDTQRNVFVLQDGTNAMLVLSDAPANVTPGTLVSLEAERGAPYVVNFPEFPFFPSGWNVETNFEGPTNWGDFHLTRMAGFVQPPVTGDYTFWIACDNSGELWLSTDENPRNVRMVASIKTGYWVGLREWSRYASQRSDPIWLEAGHAYYIEALTEQVELDEHLAVAWAGPNLQRSVIERRYLKPWRDPGRGIGSLTWTNGILREYWTNFTCGSLAAITSERPAQFGISARGVRIRTLATNRWPEPIRIELSRQLSQENDHRWVETEGQVGFVAAHDGGVTMELIADQNRTLARVARWRGALPLAGSNVVARVKGVCDGAYGPGMTLMPGIIWINSDQDVSFLDLPSPNTASLVTSPLPVATNNALGGYFSARGVVTFNDRALGRDYLVVQDNNAGVFIIPPQNPWAPAAPLRVGDSVEIGGYLLPSRYAARLRPRVANLVGQHTLPAPVLPAVESGTPKYRDGQWTELEGVARSIQPNGTLLLKRNDASVAVWLSGADKDALDALVDSTLRVRGVISLDSPESPLLLSPSLRFVQTVQLPRANLQTEPIANLTLAASKAEAPHRARVAGIVTFRDEKLLFVQDDSGAVRVQLDREAPVYPGDLVEVTGFPEQQINSVPALMDARARKLPDEGRKDIRLSKLEVKPKRLDLNAPIRDLPNPGLVRMKAYLLGQKDYETGQSLEVQSGQRVWEALLPGAEKVPSLAAGSLLELTGVCVLELVPFTGSKGWESSTIGAARLLLRAPADVVVLKGPPWWSLKKVVALIVLLVILLTAALLRVHLLRRRFERQQAARLAFARQLLENQESERRRIAANLHDTLGQNLLAIKNQTHLALQSAAEGTLQKRLEDISGTVLNAIEEVRQITHDLRPYQLDRLGLSQSIRALVRKVAETCPIELASHIDEIDGLFPKESEINIYRIVQEGINNVVKHSQATEAAVVLKAESGAIKISIRDNGRGVSSGQSVDEGSATGFGLSGIRERARIMNGRVEVDSATGQGFNLKIEIPAVAAPRQHQNHAIQTEAAHS